MWMSGLRWPVRWALVLWLFVLSAIAFMDRTNVSIAGVAIGREYQLDKIRLGWIFSAFLIGYAAFQVPGGWLASRIGPRRVLALAVLWWGLFTALTASVPLGASNALLLFILIRLGLGAGESVIYPAANQFVSRWIPVAERGRAHGWIFAGVGAGSGLTPPLLTLINSSYGWRTSFVFCAVVGVLAGAVWYAAARDRPQQLYVAPAVAAVAQHVRQFFGHAVAAQHADRVCAEPRGRGRRHRDDHRGAVL